jgi:hypothetical protein
MTPWVRHKLAVYSMAKGLSKSPVAGDAPRSEALGGRDIHPTGQSCWDGVSGGRTTAPVGARSDPRLAKPLLRASNCINTIHGATPASGYVICGPDAARMRPLYHRHAAALWRYALRLTSDPVRSEDLVQKRYCAHGSTLKSRPGPGADR